MLLSYHRPFENLVKAWLVCGASSVSLLRNGQEVIRYPLRSPQKDHFLSVSQSSSNLELRLYGLQGEPWQALAKSQLEWIAGSLGAETEMERLTAALAETQDRLVALFEITQAASQQVGIGEVLNLLVNETSRLLECDLAFAVLFQGDQEPMTSQSAKIPLTDGEMIKMVQRLRALPEQSFLHIEDEAPIDSLLLVAMPVRKTVYAAMGLIRRSCASFDSPDIKLAQAIADQIGAHLEKALLAHEAMARTKMETEMEVARQVQMSLLPRTLPQVAGLDIYGISIPASHVGGDFFNIVYLPGQHCYFCIGDVSGKGIPAALMMTMTRTVANSLVRSANPASPAELVTRVNAELAEDFSNARMFTTMFAAQYQPSSRRMLFTNAGQSPILFAPARGNTTLMMADDLPVGILPDVDYSQSSLDLQVGDVFLAATDGFCEAWGQSGEMFGYDRLQNLLDELKQKSAAEISAALLEAVEQFSNGLPQSDDLTLIVLKAVPMDQNLTFSIPAALSELPYATSQQQAFLALSFGNTISQRDYYSSELVLQELLSNLVRHACQSDPRLQIDIHFSIDASARRLVVNTREQGRAADINLDKVSMPDPDSLSEGGYGLPLIHTLVDEVTYDRIDNRNYWRMVKTFAMDTQDGN